MAISISRALVLSAPAGALGADAPVIGWDNRIGSVTAEHEAAGYPSSNLANPSTAARWQSDSAAEQLVTFTVLGVEAVDYVGLARHNLGSTGVNVSIEAYDAVGATWDVVFAAVVLPDDGPALLRFDPVVTAQIRLRLAPVGAVPPRIAVAYVGALLVLPRGVQPGLVPLPFASSDEIVTAKAESGDFLGRILTRQALATAISIQHLDDAWFRANMARFIEVQRTRPFFFAWMPGAYPHDVGYAWLEGDLRPETINTGEGFKVSLNLQLAAVAL